MSPAEHSSRSRKRKSNKTKEAKTKLHKVVKLIKFSLNVYVYNPIYFVLIKLNMYSTTLNDVNSTTFTVATCVVQQSEYQEPHRLLNNSFDGTFYCSTDEFVGGQFTESSTGLMCYALKNT